MLRLLVHEFLRQPELGEAADARFTTLAVRLLEGVELSVAARYVRELAPHPALPRALARHLATAPLSLAGPILRLSPALDETDLADLAERAGPAHLAAMAARREVSPALAKRIAELIHRSRAAEGADAISAALAPEHRPEELESAGDIPAAMPSTASKGSPTAPEAPAVPDFFTAGPEERTVLIARLVTLPPLPLSERPAPAPASFIDALLEAAKARGTDALAKLMERALGVTPDNAARIVADDTGQSLAVVARALGLSFAILSRVLFRLHAAGRSAGEMARLAEMFDELPLASAQHLIASWRGGGRRQVRERAEDAPSMRSFGTPHAATSALPGAVDGRQRQG